MSNVVTLDLLWFQIWLIMGVHLHFQKSVTLKNRRKLQEFLVDVANSHDHVIDRIDFIFCSDEELLEINKSALHHDYYTDILTFDLSETKGTIVAEIYISVDRVKDNAAQFNQLFIHELHRVIFHGLLHLLGYRDKAKKEALIMREMESILLSEYFNVPRETFS